MKKNMIYSITAVLFLILLVAGTTYSFLSTTAGTTNNSIYSNTKGLNIIYTNGSHINNSVSVVSRKEDGYNTTVKIKTAPNSVNAKSNLYIYIENITPNIAVDGFIWEVYGYRNGNQVYSNSGNFQGYNNTNNNKVPIVSNYLLSETETSFVVYFWLDGSKTDNAVVGGSFQGYIGATSETFTGTLGS